MVHLVQLLSQHVVADESSTGGALGGQDTSMTEVDEVELKDNVRVCPFQMEILKGRVVKPPAHGTHVMIAPLRLSVVESGKACPLPPELQVLHTYTTLTAGSKHVLNVVWNMTDSAIFLSKGVHMAHVVSAMLVPSVELPSEEVTVECTEVPQE